MQYTQLVFPLINHIYSPYLTFRMEGRGASSSKMSINSYCTTKHHIPEDNNNHHHCSMLTVSELSSNKHSPSYYFHYLTMSLTFVCQIVVIKIYACGEDFVCVAKPSLMFLILRFPRFDSHCLTVSLTFVFQAVVTNICACCQNLVGDFEHLGHTSSRHTNENLEKCISRP